MDDLINSDHLKARGFIQRIEHPVAGEAAYPGPPWWMGPGAWSVGAAPLLGQHTEAVLRTLAGLSADEVRAIATGVPA
jgi:crotonobetainyl-CoA:carnitine CoA-transferase CaiB-like acyl-CoA transferase